MYSNALHHNGNKTLSITILNEKTQLLDDIPHGNKKIIIK